MTKLSRNAATLFLSNASTAVLAFILSLLIGRGLGDMALGQYAAVMAWILPLTLLADFGISTLLTRDLAQNRRLTLPYIAHALRLRWLLGGGLVMALWLLAPWLASDPAVVDGLRFAALMILIDATFGVYTAVWRAWETMQPILWLNVALLTAQVMGTGLAIWLEGGVRGVIIAVVAADAAQLGAAWLLWRVKFRPIWIKKDTINAVPPVSSLQEIGSTAKLLCKSVHFMLGGVLAAVQARMMFWLLERFSSVEVIGWFAAASRFIEAARMPPFALFGAAFPALSVLAAQPDRLRRTFRSMNSLLAAYGLVIGLSFTLLGAWIIAVTFGQEFKNAAPLLGLLAWGLLPALLRQNMTLLYYARHAERQVNHVMLSALPLQGLLGAALIRSQAGGGAAAAVIAGESLMLLMLWLKRGRWLVFGCAVLFVIGLVARLWMLEKIEFDGLYGQDAFAYYNYALEVKAAVTAFRAPAPTYWPLGLPIVLAGSFAAWGESAVVGQMSILVMSSLAGCAVFLLLVDLLRLVGWRSKEAVIAGSTASLVVVLGGQFLQSSVVIMADAPSLLWATLSAWCLVRYALSIMDGQKRLRSDLWISVSALLLAWAGITRWHYLLLVIPWGLFCLHSWRRRTCWRHLLIAAACASLILIPQYAHSRQNPASFTDHQWLRGWSLANATQRDVINPDGTFHYKKTIAEFYASTVWEGYFLHRWFVPLILIGLGVALRWRSLPILILLIGWAVVTYGFLIGIPYQNLRFALAFFVPLAGLVGIGMAMLWRWLDRLPILGWSAQGLLVLASVLALYTTYEAGEREVNRFAQIKNADLAAVEWAVGNIPEQDAEVYSLNLWLMMQHYAPTLNARQIFYETPETLQERLRMGKPTYLLLNIWDIEHQWVGKELWYTYHWLAGQRGLQPIGRYGNYHLLRVNGT